MMVFGKTAFAWRGMIHVADPDKVGNEELCDNDDNDE